MSPNGRLTTAQSASFMAAMLGATPLLPRTRIVSMPVTAQEVACLRSADAPRTERLRVLAHMTGMRLHKVVRFMDTGRGGPVVLGKIVGAFYRYDIRADDRPVMLRGERPSRQ